MFQYAFTIILTMHQWLAKHMTIAKKKRAKLSNVSLMLAC